MPFTAANHEHLLGLNGFSEQALRTHFVLYQGYVNNANSILEKLTQMLKNGTVGTPEYNELKRRFGWEFNGMQLHEYYFESMSKAPTKLTESGTLLTKIKEDFGSFENWEKDFRATGTIRGIGWAIFCFNPITNQLFNIWVNEHDTGHLAGATPLLPLDVFEHAFLIDYGTKRTDYIEVFMKAVDWKVVEERFAQAE